MAYANITKPSLKMNTVLYTGDGSTQAVTGVGFQPDITWIKSRSDTYNHHTFDAVRGVTKSISPNQAVAEITISGLTTFGADGFTVGTDSQCNNNASTYASWNFKANGAGSSNSDGSITSTVSTDSDTGISIVKYTGAGTTSTVGHGLGVAPEMIWVKRLDSSNGWIVWNDWLQGNNRYLVLNTTAAQATNSTFFQETPPTDSVFYVGNDDGVNGNTLDYIAYCFARKKGFLAQGQFRGTGSTDGAFIYTGFKPRFVIIKVMWASSGPDFANHWFMFDSQLNGYNNDNEYLKCDTDEAISSGTNRIDILSNGFKCRTTNDSVNSSSGQYTYLAIAEEPLVANVGSSIPTTAR
tara:strand:+ start:1107 stop:2162 length:1056 start_codon:yes stop_codon:yes gene_type:complete